MNPYEIVDLIESHYQTPLPTEIRDLAIVKIRSLCDVHAVNDTPQNGYAVVQLTTTTDHAIVQIAGVHLERHKADQLASQVRKGLDHRGLKKAGITIKINVHPIRICP